MATQEIAAQYPELIFAAIEAIDEKNGANKSTISKHIETTTGNLPAAHSTLLSHHLNKMKAAGQLIMIKNNYVKPDPDAPARRGRGRGRPPKSKEVHAPDTTIDSPPRPRGRPPKPKDSTGPTTGTPSVSGRKRGRPPKLGSAATKAGLAASGERRGRGRPPKVKESVAAPVGA